MKKKKTSEREFIKIQTTSATKKNITLKTLISKIIKNNIHKEISFGPPIGKELL